MRAIGREKRRREKMETEEMWLQVKGSTVTEG